MSSRTRTQSAGTRSMTSCAETPDVVHDVAGQEAPPDDKGEDRGEHRVLRSRLDGTLPSPANPVGGQQRQADSGEVLLEVEETQGGPMTTALQLRPDVDTKVQIDDPTEQDGDGGQDDDSV